MCCKCALREGEAMPVCTVCHVRRGKLPFPAFPASQSCMQGSWARQSPGPPPRSRVSPPRPSCFPCAPLPHIRFFFLHSLLLCALLLFARCVAGCGKQFPSRVAPKETLKQSPKETLKQFPLRVGYSKRERVLFAPSTLLPLHLREPCS